MDVFIVGGTGFIGRALIAELLKRGHRVDILMRPESKNSVPSGVSVFSGDPRRHETYLPFLTPQHTLVQLAGVSHPNPFKKNQFEEIDFVCGRESVLAAKKANVRQLIYLSVAQPAPIMQSYIRARRRVEDLIAENGLNATIVRPWYVIGPGRRWPLILSPLYWILERLPATRAGALRLGFVPIDQMTAILANTIENPSSGRRIFEVSDIRKSWD